MTSRGGITGPSACDGLRFCNLGSGSSGNATVVQAVRNQRPCNLLVDCGFGLKMLEKRLALAGLQPGDIHAIFITHEHSDHVGCVHAFARRHRLPVWMSHGTHVGMGSPDFDGLLHIARDSAPIEMEGLEVHPFTVPHDAREPLQLACRHGDWRLGILTDTGQVTTHAMRHLGGCQAMLLETNHDPELLAASRYPPFLKHRIRSAWGHLSNGMAAEVAAALLPDGLRTIMAAHLSRQNNRRDLAQTCLEQMLHVANAHGVIHIAEQAQVSGWVRV